MDDEGRLGDLREVGRKGFEVERASKMGRKVYIGRNSKKDFNLLFSWIAFFFSSPASSVFRVFRPNLLSPPGPLFLNPFGPIRYAFTPPNSSNSPTRFNVLLYRNAGAERS